MTEFRDVLNQPIYMSQLGSAHCDDAYSALAKLPDNSINLVITSPPFALQRKKAYGNVDQKDYVAWISNFAYVIKQKLVDDGSFVLDLGGSYKKGIPVRSLYNFRVLIELCDNVGFHLAEDFYWYNPSKLPSPIEWVNKRKIRAKDAVNTLWWFSKSPFPKADVSQVLVEYSARMKKLLNNPDDYYQPKDRPSGHKISSSFAKDNGGAIPSNLLQIPNSESNSAYLKGCKLLGVRPHPARFPEKLPEFFIRYLTSPGDLVVDIFSGSNTTGRVAQREMRRWISIDSEREYVTSSIFRFFDKKSDFSLLEEAYRQMMSGKVIDLDQYILQKNLL